MDQLLSAYEKESGGKINVTRYNSGSEANLDAAASDGLKVFNLDRGEPWSRRSTGRDDRRT